MLGPDEKKKRGGAELPRGAEGGPRAKVVSFVAKTNMHKNNAKGIK